MITRRPLSWYFTIIITELQSLIRPGNFWTNLPEECPLPTSAYVDLTTDYSMVHQSSLRSLPAVSGFSKLDLVRTESARPRAQGMRPGRHCPSSPMTAAGTSPSLAVPAHGLSGLCSQSPATGPPGTRLGRDGGCAKASKAPATGRDKEGSLSVSSNSVAFHSAQPTASFSR